MCSCGFKVTTHLNAQGIRSALGDTAQESHCEISKFQRVEDVQKVFFQWVILIYERKVEVLM